MGFTIILSLTQSARIKRKLVDKSIEVLNICFVVLTENDGTGRCGENREFTAPIRFTYHFAVEIGLLIQIICST